MRLSHDKMMRLIARSLAHGGERISAMRWRWDISANCENPYARVMFTRPGSKAEWRTATNWRPGQSMGRYGFAREITVKPGSAIPYELELLTRCRKCLRCRRARSDLWRLRAKSEISFADRTWFATFTLRPEEQYKALSIARKAATVQGVDFDALDGPEQFRELVKVISPEVTNFLKRIRKNSGAKLRYLWVAEAHKSGLPHFHAFIHEYDNPVRHKVLTAAWRLGFTQFKLIDDPKAAGYLSKYLAKSAEARVRASQRYGQGRPLVIASDRRRETTTSKKTYSLLETFE